MLKANIYQISYILLILHNKNKFLLTKYVHNLFRKDDALRQFLIKEDSLLFWNDLIIYTRGVQPFQN